MGSAQSAFAQSSFAPAALRSSFAPVGLKISTNVHLCLVLFSTIIYLFQLYLETADFNQNIEKEYLELFILQTSCFDDVSLISHELNFLDF